MLILNCWRKVVDDMVNKKPLSFEEAVMCKNEIYLPSRVNEFAEIVEEYIMLEIMRQLI